MEEPSDEILSQIMREAAEDARKSNEEATERYFNQMLIEAQKVAALWALPLEIGKAIFVWVAQMEWAYIGYYVRYN